MLAICLPGVCLFANASWDVSLRIELHLFLYLCYIAFFLPGEGGFVDPISE